MLRDLIRWLAHKLVDAYVVLAVIWTVVTALAFLAARSVFAHL